MIKCVSETCDYFASYGECSSVCEKQGVKKNITNADRMRAMTDEELAGSRVGELIGIAPCPLWIAIDVPERIVLSKQAAVEMELAWLQQPAKEEHHEDD